MNWIKYINQKYKNDNDFIRVSLENYCNTDLFEIEVNNIFKKHYDLETSIKSAINTYYNYLKEN